MYLIAIAWMYIALLMGLAEAFGPTGSVLGALVTFVGYGLLPMAVVLYIAGGPGRRRARRAAEQAEAAAVHGAASAPEPAGGGLPAGDRAAAEREEA